MSRDPRNPFDDRALGVATLGTVFFCTATGLGVGAFVSHPAAGGFTGAIAGIVAAVVLVPLLMRDWR